MNYIITYVSPKDIGKHPVTILVDNVPKWLKDNTDKYVIVCEYINHGVIQFNRPKKA